MTSSGISLIAYTDIESCGRRMARAKRRAELISSGRSFRVLKLVSISSAMERGSSDSREKMEIF